MPKIPVTVYTTGPSCQQCQMTKKMMDREGIKYQEIDLREHPEQLEAFRAQGLTQAPIVTTDIKVWSGFRHNKIASLSNYIKSMEKEHHERQG